MGGGGKGVCHGVMLGWRGKKNGDHVFAKGAGVVVWLGKGCKWEGELSRGGSGV